MLVIKCSCVTVEHASVIIIVFGGHVLGAFQSEEGTLVDQSEIVVQLILTEKT